MKNSIYYKAMADIVSIVEDRLCSAQNDKAYYSVKTDNPEEESYYAERANEATQEEAAYKAILEVLTK